MDIATWWLMLVIVTIVSYQDPIDASPSPGTSQRKVHLPLPFFSRIDA